MKSTQQFRRGLSQQLQRCQTECQRYCQGNQQHGRTTCDGRCDDSASTSSFIQATKNAPGRVSTRILTRSFIYTCPKGMLFEISLEKPYAESLSSSQSESSDPRAAQTLTSKIQDLKTGGGRKKGVPISRYHDYEYVCNVT